MEAKTIVFILIALAVIAYYTDPFGWDPDGRFGGNQSFAPLAAMLFLFAGLGVGYHFGLLPLEQIQAEFAHGRDIAAELWRNNASGPSAEGATAQIAAAFETAVALPRARY